MGPITKQNRGAPSGGNDGEIVSVDDFTHFHRTTTTDYDDISALHR
jgi:hypothetical protein